MINKLKNPFINLATISVLLLTNPAAASSSVYADSFSEAYPDYATEVSALEKKLGYIGKTLPIPKLQKIAPGVYTSVGSMIWGTPGNFGFNNNMSAVIFEDGVFVYNSGPNEAVAYSFHQALKKFTNKPVKWVAIENYQGHANMGASYWRDIGVKNIYSEKAATQYWNKNFAKSKRRYTRSIGSVINSYSTNAAKDYTTFENQITIDVGKGEHVQLINFGGGHTPTMTGAYIPSRNIIFSGDLGFNERLPGLFEDGSYVEWMESFDKMMVLTNQDTLMIPGHGNPANAQVIKKQTYDYFVELAQQVKEFMKQGGTVDDVKNIDQSKHKDRPAYKELYERNARNIYNELNR
ncbi:MBL fold metallo-hydrolase [Thiomicrorhabdus lithotrophica]|uniref:MBL fold metallo-hydrolase n=1 Tax=Thiomicrorhabdus lithotrophica TaxID=2949997 RepID=A0ABY8CAQ4_9GAMM|nr:MBL fold metallo-hydrolase [Thiomicrorhabdus lithotrophica]WEJ63044.1 MBL fold metallo-hydrolase [Thiomicrorhabdus lithotrophica]